MHDAFPCSQSSLYCQQDRTAGDDINGEGCIISCNHQLPGNSGGGRKRGVQMAMAQSGALRGPYWWPSPSWKPTRRKGFLPSSARRQLVERSLALYDMAAALLPQTAHDMAERHRVGTSQSPTKQRWFER